MFKYLQAPVIQRIVLGIIFLASISLLWNLIQLATTKSSNTELHQEVTEARQNLNVIKQKVEKEKSELEREATIRSELNMKRDNEIVIQIPIPSHTPVPLAPDTTENIPVYQQWLEIVF